MLRKGDLTQGGITTTLLQFTLPMLAGSLLQQCYNIADTLIVGQCIGSNALAAVGSAYTLMVFLISILLGLSMGSGTVFSLQYGAGDLPALRRSIYVSFLLIGTVTVLLNVAVFLWLDPILRWLQVPYDVYPLMRNYLWIIFWGIAFTFLYNFYAALLRAVGDSVTPLWFLAVSVVLNIGLDLFLILVLDQGIEGAAVATVIAQLFAALYCLRAVLHVKVIHLKKEYFRLNPEIAKRLLGLGTPVAAQNVIIAVGGMVVQSVVNRYGTLFVAGFTATNKLYGILEIAAVSFGYAVTTYVGQNLGAGLLDRVKKGMHSATWIALLTSVVITVFVLIFGKYGIALFISGTAEEVSISSQVAIHYLNIMSICLSILYMLHIYRSALMGLGDTIMPMASGIMEFLMRIGVALFLPLIIGQEGIFYAEVTAWTGAAILLVTTYFLRMHKLTRELDTSQSKAGE